MLCSIGKILNERCDNDSYGHSSSAELKCATELSNEDRHLLNLRTNVGPASIDTLCVFHESKFLRKFNHLFGQTCCDPLAIHKKTIKRTLRPITLQFSQLAPALKLIPGKSLCVKCNAIVSKHNVDDEEYDFDSVVFEPPDVVINSVNEACAALGVSPVMKINKLSKRKRSAAIKDKVSRIGANVCKKLYTSLDSPLSIESDNESRPSTSYHAGEISVSIHDLKERMQQTTSVDKKIQILSLIPRSWSRKKICNEFGVSEYLVRITKKLVNKYGILPNVEQKESGRPAFSDDLVNTVIQFYENDDSSRMCPGKKDFVSIRNADGKKEQRQKRLVLFNLNELYSQFKIKHPQLKVGFSKFAQLRPKWCVLAGPHGTHSVCVCAIHQNVKLMVTGAKLTYNYKDLIAAMVCDINNQSCMFDDCSNCPGQDAVRNVLALTEEDDILNTDVKYVQWVTTDRCDLITVVDSYTDFVDNLVKKLLILKKHHFIAVNQAAFLKEKKETLQDNECIVSGDFSENFTFVVQDEVQSYHWVNAQATLHPFVLYYRDPDTGLLKSDSICIISDSLQHSTTAVYTFQKHVIDRLKILAPNVTTVCYFSDGAASQYKNRKNFVNVCKHKVDFGMDAEWHFFATSHGKGPCDGIGGTVKRLVTKASLQRSSANHIMTPQDMFSFCETNIKGIQFFYVDAQEVENNDIELLSRFDNALAIPHTRENHCFIPKDENTMFVRKTSTSQNYCEVTISKIIPIEIKLFDNIACIYDDKWYIGKVLEHSEEDDDYYIHFFSPAGPNTSFLLTRNEKTWVPYSNILRVFTALELATATGRSYNISENLKVELNYLMISRGQQ